MLMHAIAHGACADTVKESAVKVYPGRKNPLPHWGIEPGGPTLYQLIYIAALATSPPGGTGVWGGEGEAGGKGYPW